MKCTIFLFTCHFDMCAGDALHTRKCHTRAYHTYAPHFFTVHKLIKVQSDVQLRGEMVSVHEDVKSIGIGE